MLEVTNRRSGRISHCPRVAKSQTDTVGYCCVHSYDTRMFGFYLWERLNKCHNVGSYAALCDPQSLMTVLSV